MKERRRSRSRSRERRRSRSRDRSKRSSRSRSRERRHGRRHKSSKQSKSIGNEVITKQPSEDEVVDEATLLELEKFADEVFVDEESEFERIAEERKKRREEIMKKHHQSDGHMPPTNQTNGNALPSSPSQTKIVTHEAVTVKSAIASGADELAAERDAVEAEARKDHTSAFDIFSASPSDKELIGKLGNRRVMKAALTEGEDPHLQSNWDDAEGYYKARIGELIADRYLTRDVIGRGVFSVVLRCQDTRAKPKDESSSDPNNYDIIAIKLIRNNDTMRKAAEKEVQILTQIAENDIDNKKYCIRLLNHMEYRGHVAMVFEPMQMNLRETLKKFGKNVGINITAVRMYARQLFIALKHISDLRIVHADIKPDNILVSEDLKMVKLCDFGSAFRETDVGNDPTPYLISRFYRSPEVILGLLYDHQVDIWSVCICLYELFTGHVMLPGRTNNEMLRLMMEFKGRFAVKMLKAHFRAYESLELEPHFQEDFRFKQYEQDPVTGKAVLRVVDISQDPIRDITSTLLSSKAGTDDRKFVTQLSDLLDKGLTLDPTKRLVVQEALRHPFFVSSK